MLSFALPGQREGECEKLPYGYLKILHVGNSERGKILCNHMRDEVKVWHWHFTINHWYGSEILLVNWFITRQMLGPVGRIYRAMNGAKIGQENLYITTWFMLINAIKHTNFRLDFDLLLNECHPTVWEVLWRKFHSTSWRISQIACPPFVKNSYNNTRKPHEQFFIEKRKKIPAIFHAKELSPHTFCVEGVISIFKIRKMLIRTIAYGLRCRWLWRSREKNVYHDDSTIIRTSFC